jgi:hypothetical protein
MNCDIKRAWPHVGHFFTNLSGHPDRGQSVKRKYCLPNFTSGDIHYYVTLRVKAVLLNIYLYMNCHIFSLNRQYFMPTFLLKYVHI